MVTVAFIWLISFPSVPSHCQIMFCHWINAPLVFTLLQSNASLPLNNLSHQDSIDIVKYVSFQFPLFQATYNSHWPLARKYKAKQRPAEDSEQVSFLVPKFSKLLGSLWGIAKRMQKEWNSHGTGKTTNNIHLLLLLTAFDKRLYRWSMN